MPKKNVKFEQSLERLEEILHTLESGDADLEALLKLYEEGVSLIRTCNQQLQEAEQKVKMLQLQPNGELVMIDFESEENTRI